jgi:hypothetical protein
MTLKKIRFAWNHRRKLWKYRKLIANRKEIAGIAAEIATVAGAAILTSVLLRGART